MPGAQIDECVDQGVEAGDGSAVSEEWMLNAEGHRLAVNALGCGAGGVDLLEGVAVTVHAKVGENGRLFGAITGKEIAAALKEQKQVEIDKKKIALAEPIRALGEYTVRVSLFENTFAAVKVVVEKD